MLVRGLGRFFELKELQKTHDAQKREREVAFVILNFTTRVLDKSFHLFAKKVAPDFPIPVLKNITKSTLFNTFWTFLFS